MNSARIVMTTYPNEGRHLKRLIVAILKQNLGACVQRINYVKAYYVREGEIKKTEEKILLIKTTADKQAKLIEFLKKQHPYELPEIMSLHPDEVDASYLARLGQDHPIKQKEHHKKDDEKKDTQDHHKEHKDDSKHAKDHKHDEKEPKDHQKDHSKDEE
ncbi:divalent-cation tolerance protein CutA [Patescibacteria group bacterium]|nr:divalent-cation tolerance protein CutA [Patescibacteria group bacterium]